MKPTSTMMGGRQMMNSMSLSEMGIMGSTLAGYLFWWGSLSQLTSMIPIKSFIRRLKSSLYPEVHITVHEQNGDKSFSRNELYYAVEAYLSEIASGKANNLKAGISNNGRCITVTLDSREKMVDIFDGVELRWIHHCENANSNGGGGSSECGHFFVGGGGGGAGGGRGSGGGGRGEKRYVLTCLRRDRPLVVGRYLSHVLERARDVQARSRKRKLYTNRPYSGAGWSSVFFDHPASFETLAMEPPKKKRIMDDLLKFSKSKDYYAKIGRAWKRGYLLHGPPGTGKSTMIAAIANFLGYDVYDLELTAVGSNTELRDLLVSTTSKAIVVVEDIDCSLEVTAARNTPSIARNRKRYKTAPSKPINGMNHHFSDSGNESHERKNKTSAVTLSGLLNIIDGLWSVCGGERLIVFTTNHLEKLDPALIRKGRMDVHIEMSYCTFGGFKILANNYLDIDHHPLFGTVERLLEEVKISPADIAEQLMPKTLDSNPADTATTCLKDLIQTMTKLKEAL
ncbi:AAA-ATPase At3g28580-like [Aristolochia californica]|uniref:AAA-ATPase At3g28580-like n=1 Tax=Aristolochia californica TaxID=171875 RepID=UPI0035DFBD5A